MPETQTKPKQEGEIECVKCGKEKTEGEEVFRHEGKAFCCKKCCGDTEKGEHKEEAENVCEFC